MVVRRRSGGEAQFIPVHAYASRYGLEFAVGEEGRRVDKRIGSLPGTGAGDRERRGVRAVGRVVAGSAVGDYHETVEPRPSST